MNQAHTNSIASPNRITELKVIALTDILDISSSLLHAGCRSFREESVARGMNQCGCSHLRRGILPRQAPWQQHAIDQIATDARLMADNAQDAIVFGNTKPKDLWLATYQKYLNSLYSEASNLAHSVGKAVEFASVSKEYQELRDDLGARTSP